MNNWFVYIVECSDSTYYTGITTDVTRRLCEHNLKLGAKYTKSRTPVILRGFIQVQSRSEASIIESYIKKQSREKKLLTLLNYNR